MIQNQITMASPKLNIRLLILSILLSIFALLLNSCKLRQVDKGTAHSTLDSTRTQVKDSTGSKTSSSIDTSHRSVITQKTSQDSSIIWQKLTPILGTTVVVNKDGSITGQFSDIQTKTTKVSHEQANTKTDAQNHINTQNTQTSTTKDTSVVHKQAVKDSTFKTIHSDSTVKANFPIKYIVIIIVVLFILGFVVWKLKLFGI